MECREGFRSGGLGYAGGIAQAAQAIGFGFQSGVVAGFFPGCGSGYGCGLGGFLGGCGCLFFFHFFGVREIFFGPLIAADGGLVDGAAVDDYVLDVSGLDVEVTQIEGSGLQGIEEEAGDLGVDLAGGEQAHDLHEGDLDGVGVLEDGEVEAGAALAGAVAVKFDALFLKAFVEEAETVAFECGRAALSSVNFEMLATRDAEK